MNSYTKKIFFISIFVLIFLAFPKAFAAQAATVDFYVDQQYDATGKQRLQTLLVKTAPDLYFYIERTWWEAQSENEKNEILSKLDGLSSEFSSRIYPTLTSILGNEWNPGIDSDNKITVLFHDIKNSVTGYVRSADEYSNLQIPGSNQREMVYLSLAQIKSPHLKEFLAHEFTHLIIFNQKERNRSAPEEVWLNESIADYSSAILGYNDVYQDSNLQRRVEDFLQKPEDSLTEWQGTKYDYAVASLFTHYLVDQYGVNILRDSLKSNLVGIGGLNQALLQNGAKENFSQIFTNWTIAIVANNCSINARYCYTNQNLANLRINPALIFLPINGQSSLLITNFTKNWSGNWQKIVGGSGDLNLQFSSSGGLNFQVPYLTVDKNNNSSIKFLALDKNKTGQIAIEDFNNQYNLLIVIPSLQSKTADFNGLEAAYPFDIAISTGEKSQQSDSSSIQELLAKIEDLKRQIAVLQAGSFQCTSLQGNLYYGVVAQSQVRCLQQVLASEGGDIYPEGLVTGYFGSLTKAAVMRFQERYKESILIPLGLSNPTGFVGTKTRQKINELLQNN